MILNFELLKNPLNWIIVLLMLIIAGVAGHYLLSLFGVEPATAATRNTPSTAIPYNRNGVATAA